MGSGPLGGGRKPVKRPPGRAGAAREDVFINLASLIDVIFVLLLF
ncbi:hypothetical protein OFL47_13230, partial [Pseudomonas aeruginosa]|nr:hypothetical protein [Pseudomonas aeruginosa]